MFSNSTIPIRLLLGARYLKSVFHNKSILLLDFLTLVPSNPMEFMEMFRGTVRKGDREREWKKQQIYSNTLEDECIDTKTVTLQMDNLSFCHFASHVFNDCTFSHFSPNQMVGFTQNGHSLFWHLNVYQVERREQFGRFETRLISFILPFCRGVRIS